MRSVDRLRAIAFRVCAVRIFISWSGPRSHQIALALRDWLPSVLPYVTPWVSSEDIPKGARWTTVLGSELNSTRFGIPCLVPENIHEPWIYFEAGAMSRSLDTARVAPFLVGVDRKDIPAPLAQFQSTVFEKEDVRKLVHSINRASDAAIPEQRLDRTFDYCWPGLAEEISKAQVKGKPSAPPAAPHEALFKEPHQGELSTTQIDILRVLASTPAVEPTANMIARAISENLTRTKYYLDGLMARRLVEDSLSMGEPSIYSLTPAGRAYLVEHNLI